mgnify:FL=1
MAEKNLLINNRTVTYKGIFKVDELFNTINQLIEERGYRKNEKKTEEKVTPTGRRTYVELRPLKVKTNYVKFMLKIKITLSNITESIKEVQGVKKKFEQGDIEVIFDAWSITDYASRWGMKPLAFFFKAFINKFIYTLPLETGFTGELVSDTDYISEQLRAFFNLYKFQSRDALNPQEKPLESNNQESLTPEPHRELP